MSNDMSTNAVTLINFSHKLCRCRSESIIALFRFCKSSVLKIGGQRLKRPLQTDAKALCCKAPVAAEALRNSDIISCLSVRFALSITGNWWRWGLNASAIQAALACLALSLSLFFRVVN